MKKSFIILFAIAMAYGATAQIEKGTILVGASSNLGFASSKPKGGDSETSFSIDGRAGYFFIDNLAAGINISYAKAGDISSTGLGAFARYYIGGKFFLGAGYTGQTDKFEIDFGNGPEEIESKINLIPLEAGFAAFITDNIAVEPALNYAIYSGDSEGSAFGVSVGFTLYLNRGGK